MKLVLSAASHRVVCQLNSGNCNALVAPSYRCTLGIVQILINLPNSYKMSNNIKIVCVSANSYLKLAIQNLVDFTWINESDLSPAFCYPSASIGIMLLVTTGSTLKQRIKMLDMTRKISNNYGWKGIVLYDQKNANERRFVDMTGLRAYDFRTPIADLKDSIERSTYLRSRHPHCANGILGLTKYQWEALWLSFIGVEIKEIAEKTGRTPPTLYAHRKAGLNYLKLNHLHEFKNVIASF